MRIEESIIIDRPSEEVFAFLEVRANDSAWMASVVESEWLHPAARDTVGAMGVGRRDRMVEEHGTAVGVHRRGDRVRVRQADRASDGGRIHAA